MRKKYAILIGIEEYHQIEDVKYASSDTHDLAEVLDKICKFTTIRRIGIRSENTKSDDAVDDFTLLVTEAELEDVINQEIRNAMYALGPDDLFLLFAAGHGIEVSKRTYLLKPSYTVDTVINHGIDLSSIHEDLKTLRVGQRVFIYDICRDTPYPEISTRSASTTPHDLITNMQKEIESSSSASQTNDPQSWARLFACSSGQISSSSPEYYNGALTAAILEYFYTQTGELTFQHLALFVGDSLASTREAYKHITQIPDLKSGGDPRKIVMRENQEPETKKPQHSHQKTTEPPEMLSHEGSTITWVDSWRNSLVIKDSTTVTFSINLDRGLIAQSSTNGIIHYLHLSHSPKSPTKLQTIWSNSESIVLGNYPSRADLLACFMYDALYGSSSNKHDGKDS